MIVLPQKSSWKFYHALYSILNIDKNIDDDDFTFPKWQM